MKEKIKYCELCGNINVIGHHCPGKDAYRTGYFDSIKDYTKVIDRILDEDLNKKGG